MGWFLNWLERRGRMDVLLDVYGDAHWHRYYLLYRETEERNFWPNAYIHVFPTDKPDGEDSHSHPWSTMGFILRGKYVELINQKVLRLTGRWGFTPLSYKSQHRITVAQPGTTTLFMHWFKLAPWRFDVRRHPVICDFCKDNNDSVCIKPQGILTFGEYLNRGEKTTTATAKNRTIQWVKMTPQVRWQMARRAQALVKLGLTKPTSKEVKYDNLRETMVRRKP
jgi:hypothetical protein